MREIQLTDAQYEQVVEFLNSPVEAKPGTKDICEVAASWDVKPSAPRRVWFDDGRTIGVPLAWFPRLLQATPEQRNSFELSPGGIHWWELDENLSVAGLLAGHRSRG